MSLPADDQHLTHVPVHRGREFAALPVSAIDSIQADRNYVRIVAGNARLRLRATLASLVARLDPTRFARVHRSTVVNLDRVDRIVPFAGGDCFVHLTTGAILRSSRTYRSALRDVARARSAPAKRGDPGAAVSPDRRAPAIEAWGR